MTTLTLSVLPVDALIDVPRAIIVRGAKPGETIDLIATTVRGNDITWESCATFVANDQGEVNLETSAPIRGDYDHVSAMGLFCSQRPLVQGNRELFPSTILEPLTTTIRASGQASQSGVVKVIQRLALPGVTRTEIREQGLVGTLFTPAGAGPHPAVMILNGSGGGINEARGALYASHGYAAFALGYFKAPGLSDYISNTPLEYFQTGLSWMKNHIKPAKDFIALSGQSRGGELVLLLAATYPEAVSAVIAYVPGAVVHSGQNAADPKVGRNGPAWLLNGQPITHVWENNLHATWKPFDEGPAPHRHELAILTALKDEAAVERARIKVENINGPVICLSGTDDGSWPSSLYSKMITDKLNASGHPHQVEWLDFENAGHSILFPYVPTTQLIYEHPVSGRISTSGGKPAINAYADEQSWKAVLNFLDKAFKKACH